MISYQEATERVFSVAGKLGTVSRPIADSIGYVMAEDIRSEIDVSPFRNSAMDGYAVWAAWLRECSKDNPVTLSVSSTLFAGDAAGAEFADGRTVRIMTGATVPDRYDAVVKLEDATQHGDSVTFTEPVEAGANVRPAGEDIAANERLFRAGYRLRSIDAGILASIGITHVNVFRKPSVLIASTGNELVPPGGKLGPSQIYDSNGTTLLAMVKPFCHEVKAVSAVEDTPDSIRQLLDYDFEVLIVSGGVSAGDKDLLVSVAERWGWEPVFHKVQIKPGKPVYLARKDNKLLFGLPGNPLSALVTCAVFVIPALKKISGYRDYSLNPRPVTLHPNSMRKTDRLLIWPGRIMSLQEPMVVSLSEKKSSASLSAIIGSDGLIFQAAGRKRTVHEDVRFIHWQQILDS